MLSRWVRTWQGNILRPLLGLLVQLGVRPNGLTCGSLVFSIAAGLLLAYGELGWAGGLILIGGVLDSLDGELARFSGCATLWGSFLDSISDHLGDFAVYLGAAWVFLGSPDRSPLVAVLLAMFGSLFGSQVRARAGMAGIETRWSGWFTRAERTLVWVIGLWIGQLPAALWVLAVMNNLSALQRLIQVFRASRQLIQK